MTTSYRVTVHMYIYIYTI